MEKLKETKLRPALLIFGVSLVLIIFSATTLLLSKISGQSVGNTSERYSIAAAVGGAGSPSTPTGLVGTALSDSQINLSWNPATPGTSGSAVVGYRVYRSIASIPNTTPVNCILSNWGPWIPGAWGSCVAGTQSRLSSRSRTIITPAANGGVACGPLTETQTETLAVALSNSIGSIFPKTPVTTSRDYPRLMQPTTLESAWQQATRRL